jgi:hypothetical protein
LFVKVLVDLLVRLSILDGTSRIHPTKLAVVKPWVFCHTIYNPKAGIDEAISHFFHDLIKVKLDIFH